MTIINQRKRSSTSTLTIEYEMAQPFGDATISSLTSGCKRDDCRIEFLGSSQTLLGWSVEYDKYGNMVTHDPNTTTSEYKCRICGKWWKVEEKWGMEPKITRRDKENI